MASTVAFFQVIWILLHLPHFVPSSPALFSPGDHFDISGRHGKRGSRPSRRSEVGCEFRQSAAQLRAHSLVPVKHLVSTASARKLL